MNCSIMAILQQKNTVLLRIYYKITMSTTILLWDYRGTRWNRSIMAVLQRKTQFYIEKHGFTSKNMVLLRNYNECHGNYRATIAVRRWIRSIMAILQRKPWIYIEKHGFIANILRNYHFTTVLSLNYHGTRLDS